MVRLSQSLTASFRVEFKKLWFGIFFKAYFTGIVQCNDLIFPFNLTHIEF